MAILNMLTAIFFLEQYSSFLILNSFCMKVEYTQVIYIVY